MLQIKTNVLKMATFTVDTTETSHGIAQTRTEITTVIVTEGGQGNIAKLVGVLQVSVIKTKGCLRRHLHNV